METCTSCHRPIEDAAEAWPGANGTICQGCWERDSSDMFWVAVKDLEPTGVPDQYRRADLADDIAAWYIATYGANAPARYRGLADQLVREVEGLIAKPDDATEVADVCIVALAVLGRMRVYAAERGIDLPAVIAEKFAVVRSRDQRARDLAKGVPFVEGE
jgi:hypothetical protein